MSLPTNFAPDSVGRIFLVADNLGAKATVGTVTIVDKVPAGLEITGIGAAVDDYGAPKPICGKVGQTVTCTDAGPLSPGSEFEVTIAIKAPPSLEPATNEATIGGGGAVDATTTSVVVVSSSPAGFGFLSGAIGFDGPFTDPDGAASEQAGSHPFQLTLDLGFPTKLSGDVLVSASALQDVTVDLPRGVIVNPAASPELCTEAELVGEEPGCPEAAQVGMVSAITVPAFGPQAYVSPLYNMVPPPGEAAVLAFDALGTGVFIHTVGDVRSDGDYGISGGATEIPALPGHPVFGSRIDLWGDPTDKSHDGVRGSCATSPTADLCDKVPDTDVALLTLPGECPDESLRFDAFAHSWEAPQAAPAPATYSGADLAGNPSHLKGCDQLKFEPALEVKPTTNLTDSPSGLDAELKQAQDFSLAGNANSPSPLRDAVVTLPAGLVANASQADGLEACSAAQIGLLSGVGQSPVRLSKDPANCPDAAKIGKIEIETPLLAQHEGADEDKTVLDANDNPVPRIVEGALYVAKPFDNPFDSLIAVYIVVDDARTGIVAKLAGKVEPDPLTGQLTTRFTENPQLPLQSVRLRLFSGSRAALQTPLTCGGHTTNSTLTPWSAPDTPAVQESNSFQLTASPGGGACPGSEAGAPHSPTFTAGTLSPQAGAFSPMVFKLSREDGSQRISKLEATLPAGLLARLVGVAQCSDAQIAAATARLNPEEGALEKASPSCPAASELGTVDVGAGAGPSPVHIGGRAYLAGPYKGAPLSVVVITPAIAGPFDLGTVVVRSALYIDPTTSQGRVVSDPFPQILQGIPADVRSVAVRVDRPNFTLNPTSCAPMSFLALATSALGQTASLSSPFQVGGCEALGFKPKLSLRLRGGTTRGAHPSFRTVLMPRPGDANIAATSVALPHSEFIDQAHFRTICTRVQFAANQCPAGSIYGHITATSPLVDYPLEGPIYLRSSSHKLPDIVFAVKGPPSQPIEANVVARVDSVNGGIRFRVETVPDVPLTKAVITAQGGKKGLFQNSTNICSQTHRATVKMTGQNGKVHNTRPKLKVSCKGKQSGRRGRDSR